MVKNRHMPPRHASGAPARPPGLVAVIAYDGLCTFEFGIAVEVFGLKRPEFAFPWYEFAVVAADRRRVRATGGIVVEATRGLAALRRARTIVIPGWRDPTERPPDRLLSAIRHAVRHGARCVSICSGVFVLAAAGLLRDKRATTHWRHVQALKAQYPEVKVEPDVLYVDEGPIITSAGSAAGIDACIHLVRRDFGSQVANAVARRLVMPPHRDGGQAQYIPVPIAKEAGRSMSALLEWARRELPRPLGVSELAARAAMSERTFLRRFRDAVGTTPNAWLQRERLFWSQQLLESSVKSLDEVAELSGYASTETFRAAFTRVVGTPPGAYRARFLSTG